MLPNLSRISLCRSVTATGAKATWGEGDTTKDIQNAVLGKDDVCVICLDPLSEDNDDQKLNSGQFFLVKACVEGHVYHKMCLRKLLEANTEAKCPECREDILDEAKDAVVDPSNKYVRWDVWIKEVIDDNDILLPTNYEDVDLDLANSKFNLAIVSEYARRNFAHRLGTDDGNYSTLGLSEEQWYDALRVFPQENRMVTMLREPNTNQFVLSPWKYVHSLAFHLHFDKLDVQARHVQALTFWKYAKRIGPTEWRTLVGIEKAIVSPPRFARLTKENADAEDEADDEERANQPPDMSRIAYGAWAASVLDRDPLFRARQVVERVELSYSVIYFSACLPGEHGYDYTKDKIKRILPQCTHLDDASKEKIMLLINTENRSTVDYKDLRKNVAEIIKQTNTYSTWSLSLRMEDVLNERLLYTIGENDEGVELDLADTAPKDVLGVGSESSPEFLKALDLGGGQQQEIFDAKDDESKLAILRGDSLDSEIIISYILTGGTLYKRKESCKKLAKMANTLHKSEVLKFYTISPENEGKLTWKSSKHELTQLLKSSVSVRGGAPGGLRSGALTGRRMGGLRAGVWTRLLLIAKGSTDLHLFYIDVDGKLLDQKYKDYLGSFDKKDPRIQINAFHMVTTFVGENEHLGLYDFLSRGNCAVVFAGSSIHKMGLGNASLGNYFHRVDKYEIEIVKSVDSFENSVITYVGDGGVFFVGASALVSP